MYFSLALLDRCKANTKVPVKLDPTKYKLQTVVTITRHGARSPLNRYIDRKFSGSWVCDGEDAISTRIEAVPLEAPRRIHHILDTRFTQFPPSCRAGDLTLEGMDQHKALGAAYRSYLIDDLKLLDQTINPNQIFVRATSYDRTYRSALAFLNGLYPPQTMNELIDIMTGTDDGDVLRPHKKFCPEIQDLYDNYTARQETIDEIEEARQKLSDVIQYLGIGSWDQSVADRVCDYINTFRCNEREMPSIFTDDHFDYCMKFQANQLFNLYGHDDETRGIGGSYGMREVLSIVDNTLSGLSRVKFALLSSHDSTVATLLSVLGTRLDELPPLASHLTFEVYLMDTEPVCRWIFNGEVLKIPMLGEPLTDGVYYLHDFESIIRPLIDHCPEMP